MATRTRIIGPISAYAIAVAKGYTGTEEEFALEIANASTNAAAAEAAAETAQGLVESLPSDFETTQENFAPLYADLTFPVTKGQHCIHGGIYYEANTDIPSSEAWTAAHWTQRNVGAEVSDLKSAVNKFYVVGETTNINNWESGYIKSDGWNGGWGQACRMPAPVKIDAATIKIQVATGFKCTCYQYTSSSLGSCVPPAVFSEAQGEGLYDITPGRYYRVYLKTADGSSISPSDMPENAFSFTPYEKTDKTLSVSGAAADAKTVGDQLILNDDLIKNSVYAYDLVWTEGGYISYQGSIATDANYAYTAGYYRVFPGQELECNIYATGPSDAAAVFYNGEKSQIGYVYSSGTDIIVPANAVYARFSNKITEIPLSDAFVKHDEEQINNSAYFISDASANVIGQTPIPYAVDEKIIDWKYKGNVNRQKRFMAIGFDDLRKSDLNMIMPLFEKYRARATFNKVYRRTTTNQLDILPIKRVEIGNHELGDHTFLHYSFPYFDPLFNGQNPSSPDGSQVAFPSNNDFRADAGDGKNVFGKTLTNNVNIGGISGVTWADLTDEQCQTIREYYSVYKRESIITILDTLSNRYLGTTGSSAGSWDTDHYTGGIFTGCETSANYEVWERILACMQCYTKSQCDHNMNFVTWSKPGAEETGLSVTYDGLAYYDPAHQYRRSAQTKFQSSLTGESRSWTDVLRSFGYRVTHDYPGRDSSIYGSTQLFFNAWQSKRDAIVNPTNYTVSYSAIATDYPSTFFTGSTSKEAQMYDVTGSFRNAINDLRHQTANGRVHGEMIDSQDTYSERSFFEGLLRYCESAGIEVITKAEAYDICFNNKLDDGNLIGNPELINTAAVFMPDATHVETNPDGYTGTCAVTTDADGIPVLVTSGKTTSIVYGVPYGKIKYTADVKGSGTIGFYAIKNNSPKGNAVDTFTQLSSISINSSDAFAAQEAVFVVPKAPLASYDVKYEGYGDRIIALGIVYSSGLNVKNIGAYKV